MILDFFRRRYQKSDAEIDIELHAREQDEDRSAELQQMADEAIWDLDWARERAGLIGEFYDDPDLDAR